jgi:C-terminal peptidase prc
MVRDALQAGIDDDATAFVLDLRSNPGGLFPGAVDIARYFINDGVIVYIADSQGIRDVFEANNDALVPSAPLTLLVDQGTASASEVLAGSLRDNGRARIVGDTTFGKGLIQTLVPLSDGSAVSVTVARYQTPSRMDINKIGIQPDDHLPNVTVESEGRTAELPKNPDMFCEAFASDSALSRRLFPQSR